LSLFNVVIVKIGQYGVFAVSFLFSDRHLGDAMLRALCFLLIGLNVYSTSYAFGNHPESTACSNAKSYQPICTHSLHNLEGWYGQCFSSRNIAQQHADQHANQQHGGNSRWTGVKSKK